MTTRYRLKLKRLDFISPVDVPAQETAKVLLIKRRGGKSATAEMGVDFARVAKVSEELGLVFCWAFTSKVAGKDYYDLHDDNIDEDFIKACADFMQDGGLTDEMHDSNPDGRVIFGMPMTPEIAKTYGIETDTSGFMVALKPSAEVLAKFKSGEYTGVSIAGIGERMIAARKNKSGTPVSKTALFTNEVDGHQHLINLGWFDSDGCGSTTWAVASGSDYSHSHAVTRDAEGKFLILADSGHTHELAPDQPAVILVPQDTIVVVQNRDGQRELIESALSGARKSTQPIALQQPAFIPEGTMSNAPDLAKQLADLNTQLVESKKSLATLRKMSAQELALWLTLADEDATAFVSKSASERSPLVIDFAKRQEVEYLADDGTVYRKSDDPRMITLAKAADNERRKREDVELAKRASEMMSSLAGSNEVHIALLKAADGIGDEKLRKEALEAIKAANDAAKSAEIAKGHGGQDDPADGGDALEAFEKGRAAFAKTKNIANPLDAHASYVKTAEGRQLKAAYDATRAYSKQPR